MAPHSLRIHKHNCDFSSVKQLQALGTNVLVSSSWAIIRNAAKAAQKGKVIVNNGTVPYCTLLGLPPGTLPVTLLAEMVFGRKTYFPDCLRQVNMPGYFSPTYNIQKNAKWSHCAVSLYTWTPYFNGISLFSPCPHSNIKLLHRPEQFYLSLYIFQ